MCIRDRIFSNLEQHMDVTARSAAGAGVADAAQRHVLARRHAGGNLHGDLALAPYPSFAAAVLARRLHDAPFAVACRARHHGNELSEERSLSAADFTLTAARLTALLLGPGLGAGAFAMLSLIHISEPTRLLSI